MPVDEPTGLGPEGDTAYLTPVPEEPLSMTSLSRLAPRALATAVFLAVTGLPLAASATDDGTSRGHVYTMSNDTGGNALLVYARGAGGTLTLQQQVATQGAGTGAGLGSQGAVTLSQDGQYLFVVNAGSRSVSTFRLSSGGAWLASTVDSAGDTPVSVTESHGIVYVLDAGGDGSVAGFRNDGGTLVPLAGGTHALSGAGVGPAEVLFDRLGRTLVVSEKNSNTLTTWPVARDGSLGAPVFTPSAGATPFGFSFDDANHLLVSEAEGGAADASTISSYRFGGGAPHTPHLVTGALSTQQTAACWTVVTPDGRYVYTANAGAGSLSSFAIAGNGSLTLSQSVAEGVAGSHPLDLAISPSGHRLYVLNNGLAQIGTYAVDVHGRLTPTSSTSVPATSIGLAAD
jgi:6-phosphogluconolactonase (cycloisomerase 2 family)